MLSVYFGIFPIVFPKPRRNTLRVNGFPCPAQAMEAFGEVTAPVSAVSEEMKRLEQSDPLLKSNPRHSERPLPVWKAGERGLLYP